MIRQILASFLAIAAITGIADRAFAAEQGAGPFLTHMQRMLTSDDEWRTPNPEFEPGSRQPKEYALQLRLQPDGNHALGELMGVYEDGRRVTYWSLIAMYNPVTEKVVMQQIGWDGTLVYGENPIQLGDSEIVDAIEYNVNGSTKISRHSSRFIGSETHESEVFERDENGEWSLMAQWTWHRLPGGEPGAAAGEHTPGKLGQIAGYLVSGSGQWRAPNPSYEPESGEAKAYGMNFRWGQRKKYIVGEIISIAGDETVSKDWSMYVTYNPVTGKAHLYQTGASGIYFRGELDTSTDGLHTQTGLVFFPNGTVKSVRDEVEKVSENTHVSHVFERDGEGGWNKVREWTWTQLPESIPAAE